ncbi:MAG: hypothetical protein GF411_03845 [Candidatus Lokiarchaeota archaeon]|nr:hypothetical protein [Candidatus Lokiarchaeota archaeon]
MIAMEKRRSVLAYCFVILSMFMILTANRIAVSSVDTKIAQNISQDTEGPAFGDFHIVPDYPDSYESVAVGIDIVDDNGVDAAYIEFNISETRTNKSLTHFSDDLWGTDIPGTSYLKIIVIRVYAVDTLGNWATSSSRIINFRNPNPNPGPDTTETETTTQDSLAISPDTIRLIVIAGTVGIGIIAILVVRTRQK